MDNVQFEEEDVNNQMFKRSPVYKGLIGLVVKIGLAKNEVQANMILVFVSLLCLAGIVFVLVGHIPTKKDASTSGQKARTAQEVIEMMRK